jgi:hypothetical protein
MNKQDNLFDTSRWPVRGSSDPQTISESMRWIFSDIANELLPRVARRIDSTVSTLRNSLSGILVVPQPSVNGRTSSVDGWNTFTIEINLGLTILIQGMANMFACNVSSAPDAHQKGMFSFDEIVSAASAWTIAFWRHEFVMNHWIDLNRFTPHERILAAHLSDGARRFVVAHELGHIVFHRKGGALPERAMATAAITKLCHEDATLQTKNVHELTDLWIQEICADLIGMDLCWGPDRTPFSMSHDFLGLETLLVMQNMLEVVYERTVGHRPPDVHPPSRIRLFALRATVDRLVPSRTFSDLGIGMENFSYEILNAMPKLAGIARQPDC